MGLTHLVIASHVVEHVLDLDLIHLLRGLVAEGGLLYVEVSEFRAHDERVTTASNSSTISIVCTSTTLRLSP